jgi:hypothetical protein
MLAAAAVMPAAAAVMLAAAVVMLAAAAVMPAAAGMLTAVVATNARRLATTGGGALQGSAARSLCVAVWRLQPGRSQACALPRALHPSSFQARRDSPALSWPRDANAPRPGIRALEGKA